MKILLNYSTGITEKSLPQETYVTSVISVTIRQQFILSLYIILVKLIRLDI